MFRLLRFSAIRDDDAKNEERDRQPERTKRKRQARSGLHAAQIARR